MSKFIKRNLVLFFICFFVIVWGADAKDQAVNLVILHVNDTHGKLMPHDDNNIKNAGGIARMATMIKKIKSDNKGRVLALHAGDDFSRGDKLTLRYNGEVNMLAMQAIGYDAFVPGNGDFYLGVENLIKQTKLVKFPILHANVIYKESQERLFEPYIIKEIAGVKIAIIGLGFVRLEHPSGWNLDLKDSIATAKELLAKLRDKVDLVIALTHIGLVDDKRLAKEVPEIDIIVGGHSHDKLDEPLLIPRPGDKGNVIIVQAFEHGLFLGRLDLMLNLEKSGKYKITKAEGKLLPIDNKIKDDKEVSKILKRYLKNL